MSVLGEKKAQKNSWFKRLCSGSLILSCLAALSSRLVSYLKVSFIFGLFSGADTEDSKLREGTVGTVVSRAGLKNRVFKPVKRFFAESVEDSYAVSLYRRMVASLLETPLNSYGAFFITLGLLMTVTYFFKVIAVGVETPENYELVTAVLTVFLSLLLFFSRKSLATVLSESFIFKYVASSVVDLSAYTSPDRVQKLRTGGMPFILGILIGAITYFTGALNVVLIFAIGILAAAILYSPEFGVLLLVFAFPFMNSVFLELVILFCVASYILKVLRGKRNFKLGAADVFVLIFGLYLIFEGNLSEGNGHYHIAAIIVYFLIENLFVTKVLMRKFISFASAGVFVSALMGAEQLYFADALTNFESVLRVLGTGFGEAVQYAAYLVVMLPLLYSSIAMSKSAGIKFLGLILAALCVGFIVINGNPLLCLMVAVSGFVFLVLGTRRIFTSAVLCLGVPAAVLYFLGASFEVAVTWLLGKMSLWSNALSSASAFPFFGVGTSPAATLELLGGKDSGSAFLQIFAEGGIVALVLFLFAVVLLSRRTLSNPGECGTFERWTVSGTAAACVAILVLAMFSNIWDSHKLCFCFWFCFGTAGAAFRTRRATAETEEQTEI